MALRREKHLENVQALKRWIENWNQYSRLCVSWDLLKTHFTHILYRFSTSVDTHIFRHFHNMTRELSCSFNISQVTLLPCMSIFLFPEASKQTKFYSTNLPSPAHFIIRILRNRFFPFLRWTQVFKKLAQFFPLNFCCQIVSWVESQVFIADNEEVEKEILTFFIHFSWSKERVSGMMCPRLRHFQQNLRWMEMKVLCCIWDKPHEKVLPETTFSAAFLFVSFQQRTTKFAGLKNPLVSLSLLINFQHCLQVKNTIHFLKKTKKTFRIFHSLLFFSLEDNL